VLRKGEVNSRCKMRLAPTNVTVFGSGVQMRTYYVKCWLDDCMKLRYPVPVILAPAQSQPQAPQPPPPPTPTS